jgi:putative hydrolase of the HAD superfamily
MAASLGGGRAWLAGRPLTALLLDLDDTILDDGAAYDESWQLAIDHLLERHPDLPREELAAELDRLKDWYWSDPVRHRTGRLDLVGARSEILSRALDAFGRTDAELARAASEALSELRERSLRLLPGAREALVRLRELVPTMALLTNGAQRPQRAKIVRFDLEGFFDHIQVEGEFGVGKPEAAAYRNVLGTLGVGPEECLMVGDNFEADVLGAQRVGIHAAWVDKKRVGRPPRPALREHWTIRDLQELVGRLDGNPLRTQLRGTS